MQRLFVKVVLVIGSIFFLSGCIHSIPNPMDKMTSQQMALLSDSQVCDIATNKQYTISQNTMYEINRRKLQDCSYGEMYCRNLGLKPGSDKYIQCRLQTEQYQIQREALAQQNRLAQQAMYNQYQQQQKYINAIRQKNTNAMFNRNRMMNCTTDYSYTGTSSTTNCY